MAEIARRAVIAGAGAGAVGLMAAAQADTKPDIQAGEFWAEKGGVKLSLYRKRVAAKPGEQQPVLFLVHGSSNSARSSYDLTVPGKGEYSAMNVLAGFGFDVWTMDHDGYGRSGSSGNNSDIASGVEDLKAAMPIVVRETGQQKAHFYGGPVPSRKPRPSVSTSLCSPHSPTRDTAPPRSRAAPPLPIAIATARAASAMRP